MPNVDKEVVDRWIRANYPRIIGNWKLAEELYRTKVMKEELPEISKAGVSSFPLTRIVDLKEGIPAAVIGVKVKVIDKKATEVCAVCNKKICSDASKHGEVKKNLYIVGWYGGDDSGTVTFRRITNDISETESIDKSDVLLMCGMLKIDAKWRKTEFNVNSFVPVTKEQLVAWESLEDYYLVNGGSGGIDEKEFEKRVLGKEALLAPFFEKVFISRVDGRVKF